MATAIVFYKSQRFIVPNKYLQSSLSTIARAAAKSFNLDPQSFELVSQTSKKLDPSKTLRQNGIQKGGKLKLVPKSHSSTVRHRQETETNIKTNTENQTNNNNDSNNNNNDNTIVSVANPNPSQSTISNQQPMQSQNITPTNTNVTQPMQSIQSHTNMPQNTTQQVFFFVLVFGFLGIFFFLHK